MGTNHDALVDAEIESNKEEDDLGNCSTRRRVMEQVYLSRRNLMTLLAKLDVNRISKESNCTLIKTDIAHQKYPCSTAVIVTAVEDEDYYIDRAPGAVHDREEAALRAERQS